MMMKTDGTYKLVRADRPITERSASFIMPNIGTRFLYCGWEMNSVYTLMISNAR